MGVRVGGSVTVRVPPKRVLGVGKGEALVMAVLKVLKEGGEVALLHAELVGASGVAVEDVVRVRRRE